MKILIVGATGSTGKEVVKQAVGRAVTAFVRDAMKPTLALLSL
jgi:putative NADH-flavin reductase